MTDGRLKRVFHSVFFRLVAVIVIVGILMTLTIMVGFGSFRHTMIDSFERNFAQYIQYLIKDMGDPPDPLRAQAIADQVNMMIHFESPDLSWTVPAGTAMPEFNEHRKILHTSSKVTVGRASEGHFIRIHHGGGQFTFWRPRSKTFEQQVARTTIKICLGMLVILAGAYFYIRRVMQPVRWLTAAMDAYGDGNLAYRIPLKRSDEFQDLAESVNRMAERIDSLLKAKEKLILDVSHELRSPIARLKVGIEMIADEQARASLQEDLSEMETMVTEILEAARLRQSAAALNVKTVESRTFIQSVVDDFKGQPPGIRILSLENVPLTIDPQKVRMVVKNVLDNGIKYSRGSVKPVEISARRENDGFCILVEDYGIGIPSEDLAHVFEPFFRVDLSRSRETGGFGLGLSLCKAIMDAHGGKIHIESELGTGTRVTISFNLSEEAGRR